MRKRKSQAGLTDNQIMHLLHGWMLDDNSHPYFKENDDLQFPFRDGAMRRDLYFRNREFLFSLAGKPNAGDYFPLKAGEKPQSYFDYEKEESNVKPTEQSKH